MNPIFPQQFRSTNLFLAVVICTFIYTLTTFFVVFHATNNKILELEKNLTYIFSDAIGKVILEQMLFSDPAVFQSAISSLVDEKNIVFAFIQNEHKELIVHTFSPLVPKEILAHINYNQENRWIETETYGPIIVSSIPLYYGECGYLVIGHKLPNLMPLWTKLGVTIFLLLIFYMAIFRRFLQKQREIRKKIQTDAFLLQQKNKELDEKNEQLQLKNDDLDEKVALLKISEQKAIQASHYKSLFLSNMSHELRTPLNAIIGFSHLMEQDPILNSQQKKNLNIILNSGKHLLSLINDVLSIAKIEAGRIVLVEQPFHLASFLHNVESICVLKAQEKNLTLQIFSDLSLPVVVVGDEGKLRQILINLLSNAIKFTSKGYVRLHVKPLRENRVFFAIEDTGMGISKEEQEKLFRAFIQTESGLQSQEGTGLGLAICYHFVKLMGGNIQVQSEAGKGSVFSFNIPLPPSQEDLSEISSKKVIGLVPEQPIYRLLLVDDKENNRELLKLMFLPLGFRLEEASDGEEAVLKWERFRPHLIWMDLRMPIMDGFEATRQIRAKEKNENVPPEKRTIIIALTASAFEHERAAVFEAGCNDFVPKPFQRNELFFKLTEHLGVQFEMQLPTTKVNLDTSSTESTLFKNFSKIENDLLKKLYNALEIGDNDTACNLVHTMKDLDPIFVENILGKIQIFDIEPILVSIKKAIS